MPRSWGRRVNLLITLAAILAPAVTLLLVPPGSPGAARRIAGGWSSAGRAGGNDVHPAEDHSRRKEARSVTRCRRSTTRSSGARCDSAGRADPGGGVRGVGGLAVTCTSAANSCRRWTRAICSTCPRPTRASASPKPGKSSSRLTSCIKTFPEVVSVYGKIGRADTATDPAPLDMIESVVRLQTDPAKWRKRTMIYLFDRCPPVADLAAATTLSGRSAADHHGRTGLRLDRRRRHAIIPA